MVNVSVLVNFLAPNLSASKSLTTGMREDPPVVATISISPILSFASSMLSCMSVSDLLRFVRNNFFEVASRNTFKALYVRSL